MTDQAQFFGHPRGLSTLFFTEMWERFSYYGMRALLMLFMEDAARGGLAMGKAEAGAIFGLYAFGVYALALPGGWIADRLLGKRRAVLWGGCVIALGHYVLVIPNQQTFYLGLILVAVGTGLLKPNVSAIVGDLYADKGGKRDAGFSIFYMGINTGAFAGPLACAYLGEEVDWHVGFGAAGVGMTAAVIQYVLGRRHLEGCGELAAESNTPERLAQAKRMLMVGILAVLGVIAALYVVNSSGAASITFVTVAGATSYMVTALAVVYFASVIVFVCRDGLERQKVMLIALLFLGAACFWSGFEQAATVMNLFARDHTDRAILGWKVPIGWLQSVNPLFIILLAPVVGMLWQKLGERSPTLGIKFGSGLVLVGAGFLVMLWGSQYIDNAKVGMHWLVVCYFFHTVGELVLSPVGLSAMTKLSPTRLVSQMMGTWFMGSALGNLMAGIVAGGLENNHPSVIFRSAAVFSVAAGALFLILSPWMKKLAGDIR